MGRTQDGFAQAIAESSRSTRRTSIRDARDARVQGRQLAVGDRDGQRDVARAARRPLPRARRAADGEDGPVSARDLGGVRRGRCRPSACLWKKLTTCFFRRNGASEPDVASFLPRAPPGAAQPAFCGSGGGRRRGCSSSPSATSRRRLACRRLRHRGFSPAGTSSTPSARRNGSWRARSCGFYRSLDALWGHGENAHAWLDSPNLALGSRPRDLCASSKDSSVSSATWTPRAVASSAATRAFDAVARRRGAARGVDDGARRYARRAARARAAHRRPASPRCRGRAALALPALHAVPLSAAAAAARAFAVPTTPACSTAPTTSAPRARSSATGAGATCSIRRHSLRCRRSRRRCSAPGSRRRRSTCASAPLVARPPRLDRPGDYGACQRFARVAREATVGAIRYDRCAIRSHGGCGARARPGAPSRRPSPAGAADVDAVGHARARGVAAHRRAERPGVRLHGGGVGPCLNANARHRRW